MGRVYIGIDNGTSATIGIVSDGANPGFFLMPAKKEQSYTKKEQEVTRIDTEVLFAMLNGYDNPFVVIERPFVNPKMFRTSISAVRALEAVLITIERLGYPYQYIDSKEWQKEMLPSGLKGSAELKKASLIIGNRLFPWIVTKHKDRDGILIAEYARRKRL